MYAHDSLIIQHNHNLILTPLFYGINGGLDKTQAYFIELGINWRLMHTRVTKNTALVEK